MCAHIRRELGRHGFDDRTCALALAWVRREAGRCLGLTPFDTQVQGDRAVLRVAHGRMWVTFEGAHGLSPADSGDHFLDVGQQLTVQAGQRVVKTLHSAVGAGSLQAASLPGPAARGVQRDL